MVKISFIRTLQAQKKDIQMWSESARFIRELRQSCQETGAFIRSHFGHVSTAQIESKSANSLVSFVDQEAERMLVEQLGSLLPEAGFQTEEKISRQFEAEWNWIIDPLDGTTNFLYGIPHFSISIALRHKGQTILGVVYGVMQGDFYYATRGGGAYQDDRRLHVNPSKPLSECLIATGFPYDRHAIDDAMQKRLGYFLRNGRGLRRLGSAALDLCYVARGSFDLYYEAFLNPWDIAAGTLIVEEAGGVVCDFEGGNHYLENGQVIACLPDLLPAVQEIIRTA